MDPTYNTVVSVCITMMMLPVAIGMMLSELRTSCKHTEEEVDDAMSTTSSSTECSSIASSVDDIPVFRFMNGSSFYILDDDDELVLVGPDTIPARLSTTISIDRVSPTSKCPIGSVIIMYYDVNNDIRTLELSNFFDTFEVDKFYEFMKETFKNGF